MDKNLNKLERLLAIMDSDALTRAEFVSNFKQVIDFVKQAKDSLTSYSEEECREIKDMCEKAISSLQDKSFDDFGKLKKELDGTLKEKMAEIQNEWSMLSKKMETRMGELKDSKNSLAENITKTVIARMPAYKEKPEETPEAIRDKLEALVGNARLDISAIKGLKELLKAFDEKTTTIITQNNGGGKNVQYYDLSDSLNGVLKTFSMPAFHRIIDVKLSSLPTLRPIIDYTVDNSASSITFTSQVQASTDLSAGQSFIIIFSEN